MLKHLWKHEIKTQGKTMCGLYGVLAGSAVLVSVVKLCSQYFGGAAAESFFAIMAGIYTMTAAVIAVAGFIYLCVHFYQSMYSAQGYLTHTLPVSTGQILNTKIAVSSGYLFLTGLLLAAAFLLLAMIGDHSDVTEFFVLFTDEMGVAELEITKIQLLAFIVVLFALGCVDSLLLFFAGSSIGQLAKRSRAAFGIAASIGLSYATQILSLIAMVAAAFCLQGNYKPETVCRWVMAGMIAMLLVWAAVYYTISRIIVCRHLNLE